MALGPGSIAFVGYNGDGADNLAFVVLEPITVGTVIHFTDNEWTGSAFNTGERGWSWTATAEIAAGTVVTLDSLASGTATSNLGTIAFSDATQRDIAISDEIVYAYIGTATVPTAFLAAVANDALTASGATLDGTGLVAGQTALTLTAKDADADIAKYNGPASGWASFSDYLPLINDPANWITQDGSAIQDHDGTAPDVPFTVPAFSFDPTVQVVNFAGPLSVSQAEGDSGPTLVSFTVERSGPGGTVGELAFSGTIGGTTNDADFGGAKPLTFSGVIADGATSATVTIEVSGDTMLEADETVVLTLTAAHNDSASTILGLSGVAAATIVNDDPYVIHDGQVYAGALTVPAGKALTVEPGGAVQGDVTLNNPGILPSLDNSGTITGVFAINISAPTTLDFIGGITIVNNAGGLIEGSRSAIRSRSSADFHGSTVTIVNAGTMVATSDQTIRLDDGSNGVFVVDNRAGGVIFNNTPQNDIIRLDDTTTVINAGTIDSMPDVPGAGRGGDGVDFKSGTGSSLHNLAGGYISASRHAVTGEMGVTVVNEAGGVMVGRNGSAVNIDNDATIANTVFVTNYGLMQGKSGHYADSDGDAIDTDGLAVIENYGTIEGLGHNGYHNGEPNVSEAIAIGGGVINNYVGGTIYGYGRAIEIDNSSNGPAFAATIIYNEGLIQGDGNAPTDVTPEDVALFAARIKGGEAINFLGDFADTLTNTATGRIIGGVKTGGGNDTITNTGKMFATGGTAVDMGEGDDIFNSANGTVSGLVVGGAGNDQLTGGKTADNLNGGDGNDSLAGGKGNDTLAGGADDDTLLAGDGKDVVDGGDGNDTLDGGIGNDALLGGKGDDQLNGGADKDVLVGGEGSDTLTGGADADMFVFGPDDFTTGAPFDTIADFSRAQKDKIDLSDIDAIGGGNDNAFTFIGSNAFGGVAGELHFVAGSGNVTIEGDTNGDGVADFSITVLGVASLGSSDLIL